MNGLNESKRKQRLKRLGMPMNGVPVEMKERPNRQNGSASRGVRRSLGVRRTRGQSLAIRGSHRVWVRRSAHSAALATRDFRRPGGAGWRNGHSQRDFVCQGINVGAAGIVLGLMAVDTGLGQRHFDEDVAGDRAVLVDAHPQPRKRPRPEGVAIARGIGGGRPGARAVTSQPLQMQGFCVRARKTRCAAQACNARGFHSARNGARCRAD